MKKEELVKLKDGSTYRADISFPLGIPGYTARHVLADVTFYNPFTKTAINKSSKWSGAAAQMGEQDKERLLHDRLSESNYELIPIAVETLSGIGTECEPLINYILTQLSYRLRKTFYEVAAFFWQSLSVLVQRLKMNRILYCLQLLSNEPGPIKEEAVVNVNI